MPSRMRTRWSNAICDCLKFVVDMDTIPSFTTYRAEYQKSEASPYTLYFPTNPLTQFVCLGDGLKLFFCSRFTISSINLRSCELTRELLGSMLSKKLLSFCTCWRRAASSAGGRVLRAS